MLFAVGIHTVRKTIQLYPSGSRTAALFLLFQHWSGAAGVLMTACLVSLMAKPSAAQEAPLNPTLDVGVVQRFGSQPTDEMTLKPEPGDSLTLKFKVGEQEQTVITTGDIKLKVEMQPLAQPEVDERVVLSTHRSFESAEDSAFQWKAQGVEVEMAQPRQWQVWAKQETYRTPLLRRLLMQNLQAHGSRTAFIDTQVKRQEPKAELVVNGVLYRQDQVAITAASDQVNVAFNRDEDGEKLYPGNLQLQPNAYGTYTLVNHVPLETYLRGVVPHEIGQGAPQPTVEAQAILARTYALRNLRRFTIDNYQLCADTQCQVYWGLTGVDNRADQAIANTRGLVLTFQNELIDALYSSTTGGVTAPFTNVWNGADRPYLKARVDSVENVWDLSQQSLADENNLRAFIGRKQGFNETGWDMFRWRVESPLADIAKDLRAYLQSKQHPLANFTQIQDLKVLERSPAGRVQKMAITTDRGVVELEKDEILRALYAPNSTLFYIDPVYEAAKPQRSPQNPSNPQPGGQVAPEPNSQSPQPTKILKGFAFVGGGLGHGVGMSQTGAYHLGDLGWTSDRILSFYFPNTQLQPLNNSVVFWKEPASAIATQKDAAPEE
jgi:SpoIID/LytB domain protein